MTDPSIAAIVVAYGHAAQIAGTILSIATQDYRESSIQIIVVDNGSGDSAAAARGTAPHAIVLHPGTNLGFAGGCNLAARQTVADRIVLVNPDVVLHPAFLRQLIHPLEDPRVVITGGKLMFPDGRTIQHAGGKLLLPLALTSHRGRGEQDGPTYGNPADVDYVTGAALAIRRDTWELLDGFDEQFAPAYFEEVDLCLRARRTGGVVRYVPEAIATHAETSALGAGSPAFFRLYHANRHRLLFKHWSDELLAREWLPAELQHLRTTADGNEIEALCWSYRLWQTHFLGGGTRADAVIEGWEEIPAAPTMQSEIEWILREVAAKRVIKPLPFRSRLPLVARARRWWNTVATEEYLRPIVQQQNDFNATLSEAVQALERLRRTADGAVLCQGMLTAKVLGGRQAGSAAP